MSAVPQMDAQNFLISDMGWLGLRLGNRYGPVALSFMSDSSERVGVDKGVTDSALWSFATPGLPGAAALVCGTVWWYSLGALGA